MKFRLNAFRARHCGLAIAGRGHLRDWSQTSQASTGSTRSLRNAWRFPRDSAAIRAWRARREIRGSRVVMATDLGGATVVEDPKPENLRCESHARSRWAAADTAMTRFGARLVTASRAMAIPLLLIFGGFHETSDG